MLIDIDNFKDLNDRLGHPRGDECLRQVAQVIGGASRREGDLAARYGGEEFAILLPGTGQQEAATIAERVRAQVEALGLPNGAQGEGSQVVTVSCGSATLWPAAFSDGPDATALITMADRCLYEAKRTGRNRVVPVAEPAQRRSP